MIEALRKQVTEQSLNTTDLGTRSEKMAAQLRDIQEVVASKTLQLEVVDQRKRRLEEENSTLRKRLERAKKSEKLGSTDAVLMEEIRELKCHSKVISDRHILIFPGMTHGSGSAQNVMLVLVQMISIGYT
ncbi:unnamed protein product [Strongylus vulgaris]|uniref:Uncharacterized protein n=1 Tax=Strongylus vulgaris TaxID=40348 RepID=A0A3P7KCW3_STRVU|nr:unnamed protein product [Strongylus vulgaris]